MNMITQDAKKRQAVVKCAMKKGNSAASRLYGVSLSSVKRWKKRYDGTWRSLAERSHRPLSHPRRHTAQEEALIAQAFERVFERYGWDGVFHEVVKNGYLRSFSGMVYAAKRLGLPKNNKKKSPPRKHTRRYPELMTPGELVQIDVKEVPYCCLRGAALHENRHFYQWSVIDACTRYRFVYAFEEHTQENSVKFLKMLSKAFPFPIQEVQPDNGLEFTYKYISDTAVSPFDKALSKLGIRHHLIPPRTPWHNGKVERSHRNDQRYFYNWETFRSLDELNAKLKAHLVWSNNKIMRTLDWKSPLMILKEKLCR